MAYQMVASLSVHFPLLCLGSQRVELLGACQEVTSGVPVGVQEKLARGMLKNNLDSEGQCPGSPDHTQRQSSGSPVPNHELCTRPKFTGTWDLTKNKWSYVKTKYLKTLCSGCSCNVRSCCSCNKKANLCTKCWGVHKSAQGNTY